MAKTIQQHEAAIVKLIESTPEITCIVRIFDYYTDLGHSRFYDFHLDKSDNIKRAIDRNKEIKKAAMRDRWVEPDANPTLQLAAYKLMATPEEREALSTSSKLDATLKGDMNVTGRPTVQLVKITEED